MRRNLRFTSNKVKYPETIRRDLAYTGLATEGLAMKRIIGAFIALAFTVGLALPAAAELGETDRATIKGLIAGQIEAFQADDGAAAYGFASPMIHTYFPTVEQFMEMVRSGYQPVYRPQSITFGPLIDSQAGPLQKVFLTGPDGLNYVAVYSLQRQPDGTWLINGCTILRDDTPSI